MSDCVVDELLVDPDNVEIIRDQIAAIIFKEVQNQHRLAVEDGNSNPKNFDIKVCVEHELPFSLKEEADTENFPCVNISLNETSIQNGSTKSADKTMRATYFIDCYDHGNFSGDGLTGRSASVAAWKTGRIVRNIICASDYTFLKLRGIVGSREVTKMQTGKPKTESSASNVSICRIILEVTYAEQNPEVHGPGFELMRIAVDADGFIC